MKPTPQIADLLEEKHTNGKPRFLQPWPQVCLIDKRGRVIWNSDDPKDNKGLIGTAIIDHVAEGEQKRILELLAECILQGKTIEYDVIGDPGPTDQDQATMISWRVKMWPSDYQNGTTAACCVCYRLDPVYQEIKEDEIRLLRLLCEDCTLGEVAHRMMLSESAIDSKIKKLKEKMRCHNIGGLVAAAMNGGILLN